jgi:hypothetical protein
VLGFVRVGVFALSAASAIGVAACEFDASAAPLEPDGFVGCFESDQAGGVVLGLNNPGLYLLEGSLVIGTGPGTRFYVLEGRAFEPELAVMQGALAGSSGASIPIRLLRSVAGTITVTIESEPPLGPLGPCA